MQRTFLFLSSMLIAFSSGAQDAKNTSNRTGSGDSDTAILSKGEIAAWSLTEAKSVQLQEDPKYVPPEPKLREKVTQPGLVIFKNPDGTERLEQDWTPGQHARSLMESIRIAIWTYQAGKPNTAGTIGVPQAVDVWPKLRGIYCRQYSGGRYIDLQGQVQFCETGKR
jgi:hypothetical protein